MRFGGAIVDTSVLLNVLDRFGELLDAGASILLPLGAVFETGNHIADVPDGRQRRRYAAAFTDQVQRALKREAPWTLAPLPDADQLLGWLDTFPDEAMKRLGMVDLSIRKEWERACGQHPHRRVVIWALDQHLAGYDRIPCGRGLPQARKAVLLLDQVGVRTPATILRGKPAGFDVSVVAGRRAEPFLDGGSRCASSRPSPYSGGGETISSRSGTLMSVTAAVRNRGRGPREPSPADTLRPAAALVAGLHFDVAPNGREA